MFIEQLYKSNANMYLGEIFLDLRTIDLGEQVPL